MNEPFETYRCTVFPWHCDQFGHMNARWYAAHFDEASFHLYHQAGLSYGRMHDAGPVITVVAEITIKYRHEMLAGDLVIVRSGFTHLGNKSLRRTARLYNADTGTLCAVEHARDVFFDETTRSSTPMPDDFRKILQTGLMPADTEASQK
jgi:acyl-CoA thioester hydrolase